MSSKKKIQNIVRHIITNVLRSKNNSNALRTLSQDKLLYRLNADDNVLERLDSMCVYAFEYL